MPRFIDQFQSAAKKNQSLICVGLDPDVSKEPLSGGTGILEFNRAIIDATKDLVCAYKPNAAFYEAQGLAGMQALKETIEYIPDDIPVILDAKRGDIGNTSKQYALSSFEDLGVDAVTVSPYMGFDTVAPFLEYEDKTIFLLVKTSNQSSADFQDLKLENGKKLFMHVAETIAKWQEQTKAVLGIVVGATYPEELREIRSVLPDAPILLPGLGSQGGDAKSSVAFGLGGNNAPLIINSSRGILYPSAGGHFAEASRAAALEFRASINAFRSE